MYRYRQIKTYHFDISKSGIKKRYVCRSDYFYDKTGLHYKTYFYRVKRNKPRLAYKEVLEYDSARILRCVRIYTAGGRLFEETFYHRYKDNPRRKKIKIIFQYYLPKRKRKVAFITKEYDMNGNVVSNMFKNKEGYSLTLYTYDSENHLIREEYRSSKKCNDYIAEYKYYEDKDESKVVTTVYRKPTGRHYFVVNDLTGGAKNVLTIHKDPNGSIREEVKKSYAKTGELVHLCVHRFNHLGNKIYEKSINFYCNCYGVVEVPVELVLIKYKYH